MVVPTSGKPKADDVKVRTVCVLQSAEGGAATQGIDAALAVESAVLAAATPGSFEKALAKPSGRTPAILIVVFATCDVISWLSK
jgi:hypothetical protein